MKVVGKFKLGRKIYVIVLINNKYRVGRLEGNLVNYNLSDEEKKLIMVIIDKLLPKDNGIKISSLKINNTVYDIRVSDNMYMFNPVPNENDLKILNNIFNSQSECVYAGSFLDKDSNFIKRFVKLGKKTLLVLLSSTIVLSMSSSLKNDIQEQFSDEVEISQEIDSDKLITIIEEPETKYEAPEVIEIDELPNEVVEELQESFDKAEVNNKVYEVSSDTEVIKEDAFNFDDIVEALNSNPNLTQEEKTLMLSSREIFEDNYGYYNYQGLLDRLRTLKIEYKTQEKKFILGEYSNVENIISFPASSGFDDVSKSTFTHEFSHVIQYESGQSFNTFILEAINTMANNEYYGNGDSKYDVAYDYQQSILRALGEILDKDVMKKTYIDGNEKHICEALQQIDNDADRANAFRKKISMYHSIFCYIMNTGYNENTEELRDNLNELSNSIKEDIKYYYQLKYDRKVEEDLLMLYYLDDDTFSEKMSAQFGLAVGNHFKNYNKCEKVKNYVKSADDNTVIFSVPSSFSTTYVFYTFEEALDQGMMEIGEDGSYIIPDVCYIEGDKLMTPMIEPSEDRVFVTLDDSNRYISENLNR